MSLKKNQMLSRDRKFIMSQAITAWYNGLKEKTRESALLGIIPKNVEHWIKGRRPIPPPYLELLYIDTRDQRFLLTKEEKDRYRRANRIEVPTDECWPDLSPEEAEAMFKGIEIPESFDPENSESSREGEDEEQQAEAIDSPKTPAPVAVLSTTSKLILDQICLFVNYLETEPVLQEELGQSPEFQALLERLTALVGRQGTSHEPKQAGSLSQLISLLSSEIKKLGDLPSGDARREKARHELVGPAMTLFRNIWTLKLQFPAAFVDLIDQLQIATALSTSEGVKKKK